LNAPNKDIFFQSAKTEEKSGQRVKIIATSWSPGPSKGHDVYQWLERNLDQERYIFTFVGRCNQDYPLNNVVPPMQSVDLADLLRSYDIYVTASRNDPCSNSLLEAMHCGLPALGHKSGGHPEIIGNGGLLFSEKEQIPDLLDKISENLDAFRQGIELPSIKEVAGSYSSFLQTILELPSKPAFTVSESRNMLDWIDRFHDRGKMRPLRKLRRRLAVWVEGGAGQ
jgi:glycosyltransferase involved in cell wall biosynthesis